MHTRLLGVCALIFWTGTALAQVAPAYPRKEVEFIAADGSMLPSAEGADHRVERTYRDSVSGVKRVYGPKGNLQSSTPYAHLNLGLKFGSQLTFFDDGKVATKIDYVGNKRNGELVSYYSGGQVRRHETYLADVRKTGECFAEDGSPVPFFEFETLPTYKGGGLEKIVRAISGKVHYPAEAIKNEVQGKVFISFVVGVGGEVEDVKVVKGILGLDAAAVAAVKKLTGVVPGTQDGKPVAMTLIVPVEFVITKMPRIAPLPELRNEMPTFNPRPPNANRNSGASPSLGTGKERGALRE